MSLKIVVLISGEGTLLQSFIDESAKDLPVEIAAVFSNRPNAGGLLRAHKANIPTHIIDHTDFADRTSFEHALVENIDQYKPDLVVLAGFMRILEPAFVDHYNGRLINIHPALLPKYKGLNTHQRAIEAGDSQHGSSVHLVTSELDGGPVVAQITLPILSDDTPESLAERTKKREHLLYPQVLRWIAEGKLSLGDGIPHWHDPSVSMPVVFQPEEAS